MLAILSCCVFFFQAEDGIRDKLVTGVQTCALPISSTSALKYCQATGSGKTKVMSLAVAWQYFNAVVEGRSDYAKTFLIVRSEERRVGEECRSRWAPYH